MKNKTIIIRTPKDLRHIKSCITCGSLLKEREGKGYCYCMKCQIIYNFQSV